MMRLLVLSDLHVEYAHFGATAARDAFDVVVLAGDIGQASLALRWARETFPDHPIVQIAGNHEYFNTVREPALQAMRDAARVLDICFLEQSSVMVGDVEFLGCTLWTDYRLYERAGRPRAMPAQEAMASAHRTMLDYRRIACLQGDDSSHARLFTPQDSIALHSQARAWLESALAAPRPARARVVVTHHLPSWHSVSPAFAAAASNPAFASDLDGLPGCADLWIHGHTHSSHDYFAAGCRVLCNPRGYPMRAGGFENPRFNPARIVQV